MPGRIIPAVLMSCHTNMISIRTFRKFSEANVFLFSFNRAHMILRVHNMAAPAILFHNVISIGLIDLSVSASHTCRCHAPEEWVWTAPLCSFPTNESANVYQMSYLRTKILAIVNRGKKLYNLDIKKKKKIIVRGWNIRKCNGRMKTETERGGGRGAIWRSWVVTAGRQPKTKTVSSNELEHTH